MPVTIQIAGLSDVQIGCYLYFPKPVVSEVDDLTTGTIE
jgi:hypothetical protein